MLGFLLLAVSVTLSLGKRRARQAHIKNSHSQKTQSPHPAKSAQCTYYVPHGNELKKLVDDGFNLLDVDNNGVLSNDELHAVWIKEDINHDGNLTLAEYATAWNTSPEFLAPIFKVWDTDGDGYVTASHLARYSHLMDPNGDGSITLHEYEHYMTGFLVCAYCHAQHGHGLNCDQ